MKKNNSIFYLGMIVLMIVATSLLFIQCMESDNMPKVQNVKTYSDQDYEILLKNHVAYLMRQSNSFKESFVGQNGYPVWKKLKWVEINGNRILVIPMVSDGHIAKTLLGVVEQENIIPFIVESEKTTKAFGSKKIYSLTHQLLYDSERGISYSPIMVKSGDIEKKVENILKNGGTAEDLFAAAHEGESYDPNAEAGIIRLSVGYKDGSSSSSSSGCSSGSVGGIFDGHSWIEYIDEEGTSTTFSLFWNIDTDEDFEVNSEKARGYRASTYLESSSITYGDFQKILDWNRNSDHIDWGAGNTCAGYSVDIWNMVTGDNIDMGIVTTPKELEAYINSRKNNP